MSTEISLVKKAQTQHFMCIESSIDVGTNLISLGKK